jgi:hypothetical protein
MYHFRALAFAALLSAANAARMKVEVHDKFHDPEEKVAAVTVCEDDAIWEQIMASPDVSSIRAIPWKTIGDSMENYLESEGMIISSLQSDIQKLQREISDKKTAAVSKMLSDEQIQELITGSVSSDGSYGSLETAKKTACGKPGKRPRVPADSMEVATDSVVALAKQVLSTGEFKSESGKFLDVCKIFLEAGDDELENYCGEVCAELATVVQTLSDQQSNSAKSTALLERTLAQQNKELLGAKTRLGQCQQSKVNIDSFQTYLESLDVEITERHKAVRKAEADLDDAQWALDDLEQKLAEQKQLVSDATSLLTGKEDVVDDLVIALNTVKKGEDQFNEQIGQAKELVSNLREELSNMKKASEAILEIKKYVSATALKMGYYVDNAVREPVREIGLVEETNVWDYFSENVATEVCSGEFKHQLSDFHEYCTGTAMAVFEKVKKYVDLTPICTLDDEKNIAAEGDTAVQTRISLLTKDLKSVQSWLDPFKGTKMTVEKEDKKVELGEPEGLRQVIGIYGATSFYTAYLKEWKVEKGKFHELLKQMTEQMKSKEAEILQEEDLLRTLNDGLAVVVKNREQAKLKLDEALADKQAALENKEELERVMASLETQIDETKNLLTDLEETLRNAVRMYKEARTKLVSEHTAGKGGLFALGQVHGDVLGN